MVNNRRRKGRQRKDKKHHYNIKMLVECIADRLYEVLGYPKGTANILSYQMSKAYSDRVLSNYKHIKPKG